MQYYAFDGDDVGRRLEALVLSNDVEAIRAYSFQVAGAIQRVRDRLVEQGCSIVLCAGDSILAEAATPLPDIELLVNVDGVSFSIGTGPTCGEALLALKRAKGLGRGRFECLRTT